MKTVVPKFDQIEKRWFVIDANDQVLGRLATKAATILRGKNKPIYTPHLDTGDHVIIINAEKIRVTGRKPLQKKYTRYSGYPGGLRVQNLDRMMQQHPERVLKSAIKGMLPKNRLGRKIFKNLRIYAGAEHPHEAQKPEVFSLN